MPKPSKRNRIAARTIGAIAGSALIGASLAFAPVAFASAEASPATGESTDQLDELIAAVLDAPLPEVIFTVGDDSFTPFEASDEPSAPSLELEIADASAVETEAGAASADVVIPASVASKDIHVSADEELDIVIQDDGSALIMPSDTQSLVSYGQLDAPSATVDGVVVPAQYRLIDGGVKVVAPTAAGAQFAAAAGWTYSHNVNSKSLAPGGYVSKAAALKELKRCFNCSFPVGGAGAKFPAVGNVWKLQTPGQPLAPVKVTAADASYGSWTFTTLPGHFDHTGSTITFRMNAGRDGEYVLAVNATVKGSSVWEPLNTHVAKTTWTNFVLRTCQNAKSH
ncbi:hypothetical protein [Microbacterium sp. PMB16]|uniref:hypothetical protein n=1 Tax=Microbacterium sp. PMB16 TaxID=3120157 RepID=UPI003F4B7FE9